MNSKYFVLLLGLIIVPCMTHSVPRRITTPHGQYAADGSGGCTVIDLYAATQLLAHTTTWIKIKPKNVEHFIDQGVAHYLKLLKQAQKPAPSKKLGGYHFMANEVDSAFDSIHRLNGEPVKVVKTPEKQAFYKDMGMSFLSTECDVLAALLSYGQPTCALITSGEESYLLGFNGKTWLFFDSHWQTDKTGDAGASVHIFDNHVEFTDFIQARRLFDHDETDVSFYQSSEPIAEVASASAASFKEIKEIDPLVFQELVNQILQSTEKHTDTIILLLSSLYPMASEAQRDIINALMAAQS